MAPTLTVSTSEVETLGTRICRENDEGTDRQMNTKEASNNV
jgi:hypothetical protein